MTAVNERKKRQIVVSPWEEILLQAAPKLTLPNDMTEKKRWSLRVAL